MTRLAVCLFLLLAFAASAASAAAPQPPEFKDAYRKYTELAEQGKFGEAIPHAKKALDIALGSPAFDDDTRGKLAFNLGYANFRDRQLSNANAAFTIAIERLEKAPQPDQELIAEVLLYRGICHRRLYEDSKAAKDLTRAVGILTGTSPGVQIVRADALENLAWIMVRQKRKHDARKYATEAYGIYAKLLSPRHPRALRAQVLMAAVEYADGRKTKAQSILAGAVSTAEKLGLKPDGADADSSSKQFSFEELARFHYEVSEFYEFLERRADAEYHLKLAKELGLGKRPVVMRVKPVYRAPPSYPGVALRKGVMGWAIAEFTVRKDGTTADVRIVDAAPEGYFELATINAINRWRFEPPTEDGKPVDVTGVRTTIEYVIETR